MFRLIRRKFFTFFLLLSGICVLAETQAVFPIYAADATLVIPARPTQTTPKKTTVQKGNLQKGVFHEGNTTQSSAPTPDFTFSSTGSIDFSDLADTLDSLSLESLSLESQAKESDDWRAISPPRKTRPQDQVPVPAEKTASPQRVEQILAEGSKFEEQQLWSDAMLVYEKGLKNFPTHPQFHKRFRLCRYHYELGRRYHDATFEQLVQKTRDEVMRIYTDVFTRIHSNHIDSPEWKTLFSYGVDNLEIALADPEFLRWNKITASPEERQALCRKIREKADLWSFRHIEDMENGAQHLAEIAKNEIGLRPSAALLEIICGAAYGLDPHTLFLTLRQLNDFYSTIEGSFVGIGVEIDTSDPKSDVLTIAKVHPDSPAQQAGLQDGDCIFAVNGTSTAGLGIDRAADLLQGESGSTVVIQMKTSAGKKREIHIIRREIDIASVEDVHLIEGKIGYIHLNGFQSSTTDEMISALETLQRQGMKSLILDLRGNPGGLLPVAVEVVDLFLDKGLIVTTLKNRGDQSETIWQTSPVGKNKVPFKVSPKVSLYVLVDEESASASELFALAIQEHKRGLLIGHPSYGKGTVQVIYKLLENNSDKPLSGLKLTVERFYSPGGFSCCNVGIRPDVTIPDEWEQTISASKPDTAAETIAKPLPKRKRITSSPSDPYVAKAISIFHSTP